MSQNMSTGPIVPAALNSKCACGHSLARHYMRDNLCSIALDENTNCPCTGFSLPIQTMTPAEEREYFDEVAQYVEPPVTEDAPYDHARPDYRAKHMEHLASLFAVEANILVNRAMSISQSEWDNHLDWRYEVKVLEGRCHEWMVMLNTIGNGIAERTQNFNSARWRQACSWDKVNTIYTGLLKDIREFDKGGN